MEELLCDKLDDYLDKELSKSDRAAFAAHLADCENCRQEVEVHERLIERLIKATSAESPPPGFVVRVEHAIRKSQRRRALGWAAGLAASAVIGVSAWTTIHWSKSAGMPDHVASALSRTTAPQPTDVSHHVSIRIQSPANAITVPTKIQNPNVTILWIYPAINGKSSQPSTGKGSM
jgi:anti-sigma factor RsiW